MFALAVLTTLNLFASDALALNSDARIPPREKDVLIRILKDIDSGRVDQAEVAAGSLSHPLAVKLYEWMLFQRGGQDLPFGRIASFISQNPEWPGIAELRLRAEANLIEGMPPAIVATWFRSNPPVTPEAMDAYLSALLRLGHEADARETLKEWWTRTLLSPEMQRHFLARYAAWIGIDSHIRRLDRLLFARQYTNAREIAARLGPDYQALAEARIALANNKDDVNAFIDKVPPRLKKDPGLQYERLRWRRERDMDFRAMEILHEAPRPEEVINGEDWWRERHIITRRLIQQGRYESAYILVSAHRQTEGLSFAQAEWLAGWLALKKLGRPNDAFTHFDKLYKNVSSPISRSRGAYWAGLSARAAGRNDVAQPWFNAAAMHPETFYGQMALAMLEGSPPGVHGAVPAVSIEQERAFYDLELVQAARVLQEAGLRGKTSDFLAALLARSRTPEDYAILASFATAVGHPHDALRTARQASGRGVILPDYAFPGMLNLMRGVTLDWALVHGLIRQESSFDQYAVSRAGARGLMQLMPATASETAQKLGIAHRTEWLTSRPEHNVRLGEAYLARMLERFDGSYVLALAAYNAGPGRVSRWIEEMGDPRDPGVDQADWVEMIPIYETRNYVQRVLESAYVYRMKFGDLQKVSPGELIQVKY